MAKAPSFQFYPMDWSRDLEEHPLEIEGAWIRIICKLWWSETRGTDTKTLEQWGRVVRVPNEDITRILTYFLTEKIADISVEKNYNLTFPNAKITITCRRMIREHKARENNRLRQKRHYRKKTSNAKPNANITPPSSSSTSLKESNKEKLTKYLEQKAMEGAIA